MRFRQIHIPYNGRCAYPSRDGGQSASSVIINNYGGGQNNISIVTEPGPNENRGSNSPYFFANLSKTSETYARADLPYTDNIILYGYRATEQAQTWIGNIENQNADEYYDIVGAPAGMSFNVLNNGTSATTLQIILSTGITAETGTLTIPVAINLNSNNLDAYQYVWNQNQVNCQQMNLYFSWGIGTAGEPGASGESTWSLSITNQAASINCDASGNVLPLAIRPTTTASLWYGSTLDSTAYFDAQFYDGDLQVDAATYDISWSGNTLVFGSGFFIGALAFTAIIYGYDNDGYLRDTKTMYITKSIAGSEGEPATSYWLEPSFAQIQFDPNPDAHTPVSPTSISCAKYKQVGQDPITAATDATIYYKYQYRNTGSWTQETGYTGAISITTGTCIDYRRLRFVLKVGVNQVDFQDIDIVADGIAGVPGDPGRQGAVLRGPYAWDEYSASTRWWFNGEESEEEESAKWIDVILKDDTYYYCSTSYYGSLSPWSSVESAWTSGDTFDFVATRLLLAENASIDFLTGNEVYLKDTGGTVTGGLAGGNGVNFWAGGPDPANASFTVDYEGNLTATKGSFGPLSIGQNSLGDAELFGESEWQDGSASATSEIHMNQYSMDLTYSSTTGEEQHVYLGPVTDKTDGNQNAPIHVDTPEVSDLGVYTNGRVHASAFEAYELNSQGVPYSRKPLEAVMSYVPAVRIVFLKDSLTWTRNTTWFIEGVDTGINSTSYPNHKVATATDVANMGLPSWAVGHNICYSGYNAMLTGFAKTSASKEPGTIYMTLG